MSAEVARATIARLVAGPVEPRGQLGDLTLHDHQREVLGLLRRLLEEAGGALLADDVGLGKTFTALALARGRATVVMAPAGLRDAWQDSARRAGTPVDLISFEALSRGGTVRGRPDLVIIDEAHHLRTPTTKRFAAARGVCRDARVLLLTATPVQNSERDLRVLLSLFLGEAAHALPTASLARHVVRRTGEDVGRARAVMPAVATPEWLEPIDDADCLDRILALPPAVPGRDGGDAGALAAYSLARQWASSRAALDAAVRRRLARGLALTDALRVGRVPSRSELSAWIHADGDQQLAFPELVVAAAETAGTVALLGQVEAHLGGLRELRGWLAATPDPDAARVARLRGILERHPGARVVAFSEFSETVGALYARLAHHVRAAMVTHTGGRVAGGPLSRKDVLARFAPDAPANDADRIDLLLTTDVLSEGVGLHAASVVVHLDLAWNPARLEQRVGRLRRLGAPHGEVTVYVMPPPAAADRLLRLEDRLRAKVARAEHSVGVAGAILPNPGPRCVSSTEREQRIASVVAGWRGAEPAGDAVVSAVRGARECALVCVRDGARIRLLAWDDGRVSDATADVERVLRDVAGPTSPVPAERAAVVVRAAGAWLARHRVGTVVDLAALRTVRSRRWLLHRAEGISRRAPRHARARVAAMVQAVRAAATAPLSAGAERVLDDLARAPLPDEAWLRAVGEFAALHSRASGGEPRIEVVLLVVP